MERDIGLLIALAPRAMGEPACPEIVLVHHTQCGVEMLRQPEVVAGLSRGSGIPSDVLEGLAIHDHSDSLRADIERLKRSPRVAAGARVSGLRYDQTSGKAEVVEGPVVV